jgi:ubiquinone/menaquinone biosynthesis C-methylase UbiE
MTGHGKWKFWLNAASPSIRVGDMSEEPVPIHGFSESAYLRMNPDVKRAVRKGSIPSGWQHFVSYGFRENRAGVSLELVHTIKSLFDDDTAESLPPKALRKRVHGDENSSTFATIGKVVSCDLIGAINSTFHLGARSHILDFGCGCGRVMSYFHTFCVDSILAGTDIDREAISWCQQHLSRIGTFSSNDDMPPLQFSDEYFDFVYSISVFTHLPEEMEFAWLEELKRVTKRGGYLILTTHGKELFVAFDREAKKHFRAAGFYYSIGAGTEGLPAFYQTSYHTEDYIYRRWGKIFDIIKIVKQGIANHQDLVVCRKGN